MVEGQGYGYNTMTAIIARGVTEMQLFARIHGADKQTFYGLSGMGDIMLTCFGHLSRNRQFGVRLGKGEDMDDIIKSSKGVVEGLPTLKLVHQKASEAQIDMPITSILYRFVYREVGVEEAKKQLMSLSQAEEFPPTFEDLTSL